MNQLPRESGASTLILALLSDISATNSAKTALEVTFSSLEEVLGW